MGLFFKLAWWQVSDSLWVSTAVSLNLVIILIMADQGHFLTHELVITITTTTTTIIIIIIIIIIRAEVWWRIKCEAQVTSMKDNIKWKVPTTTTTTTSYAWMLL
jgi:hypothetical protein